MSVGQGKGRPLSVPSVLAIPPPLPLHTHTLTSLSPLPSHELPSRNGSPQFLEVPRSLAGDHNSLSRVLTALPPVEDTVELRRSDVVFRRQASATSTSSVCSDSCSRRGSGRGSFHGVDDFVFSSNNIARIRIVLDLV